jgi:hypothetical protein
MNYYLIFQENQLQIVPVRPEQEALFRERYSACILVFGTSFVDVLRKFHELPLIFGNGV